MTKTKQIDTSLAAYHSLDQKQISDIKRLIIEALKKLGKASSEQLADYIGKPYDCCWKRCSDLKNEGIIFSSNFKVLTKRNRFARQWMLIEASNQESEKALKGKPTVADYSRNIQNITAKQQNLF